MRSLLVRPLVIPILLACLQPQVSAQSMSRAQRCVKQATARYVPLRGYATLKQEQQFQADLVRCTSPGLTGNQALCVGAARYDITQLSTALVRKKITPAQYIQRTRDRNRKADRCVQDRRWSAAYSRGDRDGDLVPDAYDRCGSTPNLAATSDDGCPATEAQLSDGPSPEDMDRFFKLHTMLPNPHCSGAPVPTVPAIRRFASVNWPTISPAKLRSEFRGAVDQPAACPVVYQVWVEEVMRPALDDPAQDPRAPLRISMLLKPKDALRVDGDIFTFESEHDRLDALFHQGARAKIRAINGQGLTSPWSEFLRIPGR